MQAEAASSSQDRSFSNTPNFDPSTAQAQPNAHFSANGFYTSTTTTLTTSSSGSSTAAGSSFNYGPSWEESLPLVAQQAVRNLASDQAALNRALLETYANVNAPLKGSLNVSNVVKTESRSPALGLDGNQDQSTKPFTMSFANGGAGGNAQAGTGTDYYSQPFPQTLPMYKPQSQQSAYFQRMMAIKLANASRDDPYGGGGTPQQQSMVATGPANEGYDASASSSSASPATNNGSRLPTYPNLSTNDVTVDLGTYLPTSSSPLYQMLPQGFAAAAAVAAAAAAGNNGAQGNGNDGSGYGSWPYTGGFTDMSAAVANGTNNSMSAGFQPHHSRTGSMGGGEAEHGGPSRSYSPQTAAAPSQPVYGFPGWLAPHEHQHQQMALHNAWSRSVAVNGEEAYQQPPAPMRVPYYPPAPHPYFMPPPNAPQARFDIDPSLSAPAMSNAGPSRTSEDVDSSASAQPPAKRAKLNKKDGSQRTSGKQPKEPKEPKEPKSAKEPKENRIPIDQVRLVKPEGPRKAVLACHFCRGRKLRCDGAYPCTHCARRSIDCSYDSTVRRRGPGKNKKTDEEKAAKKAAKQQQSHDGSGDDEKPKSKRGRKPKAKKDAKQESEAGDDDADGDGKEDDDKSQVANFDPALANSTPTNGTQGESSAYTQYGPPQGYNNYAAYGGNEPKFVGT